MKKSLSLLLIGFSAIIVTVLLYFAILGNFISRIICLITLFGVIFAEISTVLLAIYANKSPRRIAAVITMALMIPVSILLSIVYIKGFPFAYGKYLALYFVCFIVLLTVAFILFSFVIKKNAENNNFQIAKNNMLNLRKVVKIIAADPTFTKYSDKLNKIEDELHFSNDSVIMPQDNEIYNRLTSVKNLSGNQDINIDSELEIISKLINERNIISKKTL